MDIKTTFKLTAPEMFVYLFQGLKKYYPRACNRLRKWESNKLQGDCCSLQFVSRKNNWWGLHLLRHNAIKTSNHNAIETLGHDASKACHHHGIFLATCYQGHLPSNLGHQGSSHLCGMLEQIIYKFPCKLSSMIVCFLRSKFGIKFWDLEPIIFRIKTSKKFLFKTISLEPNITT
jgi:hypothetical protein